MSDSNITQESLPDASQLNAADESGAVSSEAPALTLEQLNAALGKQFKDVDSAIKSVKDTFSYVGQKVEKVKEEIHSEGYISKSELDSLLFYRDNPDYGQYRDVIDAYAAKAGVSPAEAVRSDALSALISKAKTADSYQETQSVIETNPRLVASRDSISQAKDLLKSSGKSEDTDRLAVKAVLDAYEG